MATYIIYHQEADGWVRLRPGIKASSLHHAAQVFWAQYPAADQDVSQYRICPRMRLAGIGTVDGERLPMDGRDESRSSYAMRSAQEIIDQTNELSRDFYGILGYTVRKGYRFDKATHPQERQVWHMACAAQALLTQTDVRDAVDECHDRESSARAEGPEVNDALDEVGEA